MQASVAFLDTSTRLEEKVGRLRCAAVFASFAPLGDRERLLKAFSTGRYRLVG